jgi:hypothetical protein
MLMSAVLKMSGQLTFEGIDSVTSLPASADGQKLLDLLDGPRIVRYGPALVRASLSARQAREMGLLTSGTYGRPGSTSLRSAVLQSSLVSRLTQQLSTAGSTLFSLTWKELVTPSRRSLSLLRALALRTGDTGFGSWPTPMAGTPAQKGYNEAGNNDGSRKTVALLAPWSNTESEQERFSRLAREQRKTSGFWTDADWIPCCDGKWRPIQPGVFPLVNGLPSRLEQLRGFGNAIVPQVAAQFIKAYATCS